MLIKIIFPLVFTLGGVFFLLIAVVFFPHIMDILKDASFDMDVPIPAFWNLDVVGAIVRVIFTAVGVFITLFGVGLLILRNRIDWF